MKALGRKEIRVSPQRIEVFRSLCRPINRTTAQSSNSSPQPDTFFLSRILGNDLFPRHRIGQTRENLRFILDHETDFPRCQKHWIVNRIVDSDEEAALLELLNEHGQDYTRIPFEAEAYQTIARPGQSRSVGPFKTRDEKAAAYRTRNNYVMNNNGARNLALQKGRERADWVLPWDGNCFLTEPAFQEIRQKIIGQPFVRHVFVPMARLNDNQDLFSRGYRPEAIEEPQVIFRSDSKAFFHPEFAYGRRPKVELFWHLGFPGPWDLWQDGAHDIPRRALSDEAYLYCLAGWVARIASGHPDLELGSGDSFRRRGEYRDEAIFSMIDRLDQRFGLTTI
jgi:hypothetical protein